ncbi:MAG: MoxR family ATPase [Thermodesulfovibrionales bacterium]|nr:MoxR family ATPase [Thermodesulfovibrionales bacterium]
MADNSLRLLQERIDSVIKGKPQAVKMAIVTLLGRGHLMIEDVPGVGKTTLAFTLAKATNCSFQRIQFTSDMLPTDIIGVSIYNPDTKNFDFKQGPIFANIVLADEINRTSPKTQSALLEAMNERRVSVDRKTYTLPEPFMVIATQNPIEYHGTFPLPESQIDRFMMHIKLGYPETGYEKQALVGQSSLEFLEDMQPVITGEQILRMQKLVDAVKVDDSLLDYLMSIIIATRNDEKIRLGASTRGAQFLLKAAKANAFYEGREYVVPEDIKDLAPTVLGHRLILKARTSIYDSEVIMEEILERISVPV